MSSQEARNTAAGMVRDALARLVGLECVQDLRRSTNTKEAAPLLDFAEQALIYFEHRYDFPQQEPELSAGERHRKGDAQ